MSYFPTIAQPPAWKSYLRTSCVEASNRKDERPVVRWLQEVEEQGKTMADFAISGRNFERLDRKLAHSLKRICKGELSREVIQQEAIAGKKDLVLKGREIFWMILQVFKSNPNMGLVYGVKHFTHLKWNGDDNVETFKNNWLEVVNLQRVPLAECHLAEMLLDFLVLDNSECMKNDIAEPRGRLQLLDEHHDSPHRGEEGEEQQPCALPGYRERRQD